MASYSFSQAWSLAFTGSAESEGSEKEHQQEDHNIVKSIKIKFLKIKKKMEVCPEEGESWLHDEPGCRGHRVRLCLPLEAPKAIPVTTRSYQWGGNRKSPGPMRLINQGMQKLHTLSPLLYHGWAWHMTTSLQGILGNVVRAEHPGRRKMPDQWTADSTQIIIYQCNNLPLSNKCLLIY